MGLVNRVLNNILFIRTTIIYIVYIIIVYIYIYTIIISQFKFTYVKEEIIKINKLRKIVL